MKLLHTSDWHLGRLTYGQSRAADHDAVLTEIIDIARDTRPDVICHTGDLYDRPRPADADLLRGIDALQELAAIAPVVVVCGNHDSTMLFKAFNRLLGRGGRLRFIGRPRLPDDGGVLHFPTADGAVLRLAVLPFVHANQTIDAFADPAQWGATYTARIRAIEAVLGDALVQGFDDRRDVAMFAAHLPVGGAAFCGSERQARPLNAYATDLDGLPPISYAAFGHLHKPQPLPSTRVTGRYAGSPLQLDFGETNDQKSVVLVDVRPGQPAHVDTVNLTAGRRLFKWEGSLDELRAMAPAVGDEICLLTVHTPTPVAALSEQVYDLLPKATVLPINQVCADQKIEIITGADAAADAEPDITTMFREFLADQRTKGAAVDRVMDIFATLLHAVAEEREPTFPEEQLLTQPVGGHAPEEAAS